MANEKNNQRPSVSTQGIMLFSNMMLSMRFSDSTCYISLRDAKVDENGKRSYPRPTGGDKDYTVSLTKERAAAFLNKLHNKFVPQFIEFLEAKEENPSFDTAYSVGVPCNRDMTTILSLSTGKPNGTGPYSPELSIFFDIDPSTKIPKLVKTVKLDECIATLEDYDPATGEFSKITPEYPLVVVFITALEEFVKSTSGARAHENAVRFDSSMRHSKAVQNATATKVGVSQDIIYPYGNNGQGSSVGAVFSVEQSGAAPEASNLKQYDGELNLGEDLPF